MESRTKLRRILFLARDFGGIEKQFHNFECNITKNVGKIRV